MTVHVPLEQHDIQGLVNARVHLTLLGCDAEITDPIDHVVQLAVIARLDQAPGLHSVHADRWPTTAYDTERTALAERAVTRAAMVQEAAVPYKQFCVHPDLCRGLSSCPRDPSCCE